MPKIGDYKTSTDSLCTRCGGKRKVSKKWTEKIQNSGGFMTLNHTEYVCTNKECQAEFDRVLASENLKREKLKQIKIDDAAKRAAIKVTV